MHSFCQVRRSFTTFSAVPDSSSDKDLFTKENEQMSSALSSKPVSVVDTNMFNVFLAVPGQEEEKEKIRFTEHVYTISEEDLATSDDSLPVRDVTIYTECVSECKNSCSK